MNNILIVGCYHSMNSGVMAMAEAIVQKYPDRKIFIMSSNDYWTQDKERYSIYSNVELVETEWLSGGKYSLIYKIIMSLFFGSRFKVLNTVLKQVNTVIDISGDSISSDYGTKSLFLSLLPNFLVDKKRVDFIYAPQTLGPFKTFAQRKLASFAFNKDVTIYLREGYSSQFLNEINVINYSLSSDLAFMLASREVDHEIINKVDKNTIALGVSSLVKKFGATNYTSIFQNIINVCLNRGFKVLLINHVSTKQGNDIEVARLVKTNFFADNENVMFVDRNFRASEWKYIISKTKAIVTARMHPAVHALSQGIPALNLSYNHKSLGVVKEAFYPYGQIVDIKSSDLIDVVEKFIDDLNKFEQEGFKEKIEINARKVLPFLERINSL
ncbi:polysaccharide pyruvyl transferase family protein [Cytophagales bacterium LB-30]|uniref:Polysaccharide pyruvyl transferase family protein n=1 Tax=Shiella aurantiaca TaxID=3058365 RepID=A0ABT8F2H6_9BACT|nr:polysaccharide pyruvyl transferase family protein [Shiella aurantiaca]MDN4164627.1 polysaccharide pyruvyl transferase family protein [Shiella aurantiaca]